jgi:ComF family protein
VALAGMEYLKKIVEKSRANGNGNYGLPGRSSVSGILPQAVRHRFTALARSHLVPPESCLLCGADSGNELLCCACLGDLPPLPVHRCPRCGETTTYGEHCGSCLQNPPAFSGVSALYRYDFPVDRLVHALKYGHQLALADWFGKRLAELLVGPDFTAIIPLPLHPQRLRERGFNQSLEIARTIAGLRQLPLARDLLQRQRATASQAGLDRKARQRNVRGAFACHADCSGQRLLLVDDVLTSGATADEAARSLIEHGALEVHVAVVARTLNS